jgi:phosphatidylserine/phosphatidylglycerophosphate/cardiolipin synthase-like enzyme
MNWMEECLRLVRDLPASYVEALIASFRRGESIPGSPNPRYTALACSILERIPVPRPELAAAVEMALYAERQRPKLELVWTGPASTAVPVRQTEQVLLELIRQARRSLTLLSFGAFDVPRVVSEIGEALQRNVAVRIVLGEREHLAEAAQANQLVQLGELIGMRASIYRWPVERRLRDEAGRPGLMHIKAALIDGQALLLSSANLTGAALERNMELGIVVHGGNLPQTAENLHLDTVMAERLADHDYAISGNRSHDNLLAV